MLSFSTENLANRCYLAAKERQRLGFGWFPLPILLATFLVLLLSTQLLPGLNPRIGSPSRLLKHGDTPSPEGAIWFTVSPLGQELVVTTADRQVFRWPISAQGSKELEPFKSYLKERVHYIQHSSGLSLDANPARGQAVIAADDTLSYFHIRPILNALAEAGIAHYGFETFKEMSPDEQLVSTETSN